MTQDELIAEIISNGGNCYFKVNMEFHFKNPYNDHIRDTISTSEYAKIGNRLFNGYVELKNLSVDAVGYVGTFIHNKTPTTSSLYQVRIADLVELINKNVITIVSKDKMLAGNTPALKSNTKKWWIIGGVAAVIGLAVLILKK